MDSVAPLWALHPPHPLVTPRRAHQPQAAHTPHTPNPPPTLCRFSLHHHPPLSTSLPLSLAKPPHPYVTHRLVEREARGLGCAARVGASGQQLEYHAVVVTLLSSNEASRLHARLEQDAAAAHGRLQDKGSLQRWRGVLRVPRENRRQPKAERERHKQHKRYKRHKRHTRGRARSEGVARSEGERGRARGE